MHPSKLKEHKTYAPRDSHETSRPQRFGTAFGKLPSSLGAFAILCESEHSSFQKYSHPQLCPSWIPVIFLLQVRVEKKQVSGWIRFLGTTKFAEGDWVGVELEEPRGKNDGSVKDQRYFTCEAGGL